MSVPHERRDDRFSWLFQDSVRQMANGGLFGDVPPPVDPGPSLEALNAIIETKVRTLL